MACAILPRITRDREELGRKPTKGFSWERWRTMVGKHFLPVEDKALKDFVKKRTGDELAPVGRTDDAWTDLARHWKTLGKVKGFGTDRNARAMYQRHVVLRKKAGRVDSLLPDSWTLEEEKALLDFVKERKGDEMAAMWRGAFKKLEKAWQSKGFGTTRSARALNEKHKVIRKKRAKPIATSATASLSGSCKRKHTASTATSPPSNGAKKSKVGSLSDFHSAHSDSDAGSPLDWLHFVSHQHSAK